KTPEAIRSKAGILQHRRGNLGLRSVAGVTTAVIAGVIGVKKPLTKWDDKDPATNKGLPNNGIDYETISTAKPHQATKPRDLNEQTLWNRITNDASAGRPLPGLNNDPRFKSADGFQKMEAVHTTPSGETITIHYQYNSNSGRAYDMKYTTPQRTPPVLQPGPSLE
ncbi:hypothetical protein, partial [Pseudovibrio axinellae]